MNNKMSIEHENYLMQIKKEKRYIKIAQLLVLIVFLSIWQIAAKLNLIDTFLTSSPKEIFELLIRLIKNGSIFEHVIVSTEETIVGFLLGTSIGIFTAILLWWSERTAKILDPYLVILNSLPKAALGPIIILWAGAGFSGIVVTAAAVSVVITIMTVYTGFKSVEKDKIILLKTFGASKLQILRKVIIPANIPVMINATKVNIGLSWVGVIVGEFLVSKAGIGYLIVYGGQVFKLDLVMTSVFVLAVVASLMYFIAAWIEKKVIKY